ncbi:DegQ family serine endoprotease [Hydrogenophaga sp. 5NK40-0174]
MNIRTTENVLLGAPDGADEQMREFLRRFGIPVPPEAMPRGPRQPGPGGNGQSVPRNRGIGSGFVLSDDGLIMTNAHVVDGADEIIVTLSDKREFKAKLVGADKRTDVAVLRIEASDLKAVKIGDIERLRVGEWVMAIGSPFGLENTVTAGIVSAKQRETGDFLPFIQTDVAINPGNSGGPLINLRGEVVGINSQIYSRSGGFQGISFAIPIDEAMRVADQLSTSGKVTRGRIGVQIDRVGPDVAESIGLGRARGALVRAVQADSPAAAAGVKAGDIILKFDGKPVGQVSDLPRIVANTDPGRTVSMDVFRQGTSKQLSIQVGVMEADGQPLAQTPDKPAKPAGVREWGITVSPLPPETRQELGVDHGVVVTDVESAAARAGVAPGDVILSIGNREIADIAAFEKVTKELSKARNVSVLLRRGEWVQYVVIQP